MFWLAEATWQSLFRLLAQSHSSVFWHRVSLVMFRLAEATWQSLFRLLAQSITCDVLIGWSCLSDWQLGTHAFQWISRQQLLRRMNTNMCLVILVLFLRLLCLNQAFLLATFRCLLRFAVEHPAILLNNTHAAEGPLLAYLCRLKKNQDVDSHALHVCLSFRW